MQTLKKAVSDTYDLIARQYGPLDDRLRMLFYGLLLFVSHKALLVQTPDRLTQCPPEFFDAVGIMELLPASIAHPAQFATAAYYLIPFVWTAWILCAIGFGGRLPQFVTALGFSALYSMTKCCSGTGHGLHLAMYALIILALFTRPGRYSLDGLIATYWPRYPLRPRPHVDASGFARTVILGLAIYTLFAGGLTKLYVAGFHWLDGETLQIHVGAMNEPKGQIGEWILGLVLENRWIAAILSTWTILLEVGSILALFFPRARNALIVNAWLFHFGIYLIMLPKYFPQMVVYLLIFHWRPVLDRISRKDHPTQSLTGAPFQQLQPSFIHKAQNVLFVFVLVASLMFIWARQKEWYPLTHIPMYSDRLTATTLAGHAIADFDNIEGLQRISKAYDEGQQGWFFTFWLPRKIEVHSVSEGPDGTERSDVTDVFLKQLRNWPVWNERIAHATLSELHRYEIKDGQLLTDKAEAEVCYYLQGVIRTLGKSGEDLQWQEMQLVLKLNTTEQLILCSLPARLLDPTPRIKTSRPLYR